MKPRAHFSRSYTGRFPTYLCSHQLEVDKDFNVSYNKDAIIGECVHHVDLRFWECADVDGLLCAMPRCRALTLGPRDDLSSILSTLGSSYSDRLHRLAFEPETPLTEEDYVNIASLTQLRALSLESMNTLTDPILENILRAVGGALTDLNIGNCAQLTDATLQSVALYCPNLEVLLASGNGHYTNAALSTVAFRRPSLQKLDISNCRKLTFLGLLIKQGDLLQYANRNWTTLNVSGCRLEAESLVWISSALTELVEVDFSSVLGVTNQILEGLALNCPLLTRLNLANCTRITDDSIRALASCCTRLVDVNMSCVGDVSSGPITELINRNALLETLDISGNMLVKDGLFGDTTTITRLKRLHIRSTGLTSFGIACMAERCPLLKYLNISKLSKVNDAAINVVSECCPYLETLIANDCYGITDEGMIKIVTRCRGLVTLSLCSGKVKVDAWGGRFEQYTDDFMEAALGCCKKLQTLLLVNQHGIKLKSKWLLGRYNGSVMHEWALAGHSDDPQPTEKTDENSAVSAVSKLTDSLVSGDDQTAGGTSKPKHRKKPKTKEEEIKILQNQVMRKDIKARDAGIAAIPTFQYKGGFAGHASLRTLDLRGLDDLYVDSTLYVLSRCYSLTDVKMPFGSAFDDSGYERKHSRRDLRGEAFYDFAFSKTCYSEPGSEYDGLVPYNDCWRRRMLEFRDTVCRRIILEKSSAAFIQKVYKIHKWYTLHRLVGVTRRIVAWLVLQREKRKWWADFNKFVIMQRARCIQKYFRKNFLPFVQATMRLQRITRGWFARVLVKNIIKLHASANLIQKIARGMITRISDRYILAQIYMKLPPFWKSVVQSSPNKDTTCRVEFREMKELRLKAADLKGAIEDSFKRRGKQIHGSVPEYVSQPFDRRPYVSTVDGRKISYYSTSTDGIIKAENENPYAMNGDVDLDAFGNIKHRSVHPFNVQFWPMVHPDNDAPTFSQDSHKDAFDMQGNYQYQLHCELCAKRLMMIHCQQCNRGFCFVCAFRAHIDRTKRKHHMEIMEPRVTATKEVSNTMVYHVDMAHRTMHNARQLVNVMKNTSELKRIEQERKIAREMEEERIRQMIAAERAAEESEDKHMAITLIVAMFRGRKARKYVKAKQCQVMLQKAIDRKRVASAAAAVIQHCWRGHNTRKELQAHGFKVPSLKELSGTKKKKRNKKIRKILAAGATENESLALKKIAAQRAAYEQIQRRVIDRTNLFHKVFVAYLQIVQFLRAAANTWIVNDGPRKVKLRKFIAEKEAESIIHFELQKEAGILEASLTPAEKKSNAEYLEQQVKVKQSFEKIKTLDMRAAVCKNIGDWVVMVVRSHLRRKSIVEARFEDMIKRLQWLAVESASVDRITAQLDARKAAIGHKRMFGNVVRWMAKHARLTGLLNSNLDAQQESILKDSLAKLTSDEQNSVELESLAAELINALEADSHATAERSYLDRKIMESKPGSDEMVSYSEKLLKIKQKQLQLNVSVIDTIKGGLEDRFKREDDQSIGIAGFPDDSPELSIGQMPALIKADLLEKFKYRPHITVEDFFSVVYTQPWHSEDAVLDVRFEEKIQEVRLNLDTLHTEAKLLDVVITTSRERIAETKALLGELRAEAEMIQHGGEFEGEMTREEAVGALEQEIIFKENELSVAENDLNTKITLVEPNAKKSTILSEELVKLQEILELRLKERLSAIEQYFKLETSVNHDAEDILRTELIKNENQLADLKEKALFFEGSEAAALPKRTVLKDIELAEYVQLRIAREDGRFDEQISLHKSKPSMNIQPVEYARMYISLRHKVVQVNTEVLEACRELLQDEKKFVKKFVSQRKIFEEKLKVFMNSQLALRRQRSIAKEIEQRRKRLEELRAGRLAAIKALHDQEVAHQKELKEQHEAAEKFKPPSLTAQLAQATKTGLRNSVDAYRRFKQGNENALDPEEERMGSLLRKRVKGGNTMAALRKIKITFNRDQSELFEKQNNLLLSKALPNYKKLERAINNEGDCFLWFETTKDTKEFITDIQLSHADPAHPLYRDLSKSGYENLGSPDCRMVMWVIREKRKKKGICDLVVCFDESEENKLLLEGYEKIDTSLVNFNMPDIYFWIKKADKLDTVESQNTNALIAEVKGVQKMLAERPDDEALMGLYKRLHAKLQSAHEVEKESVDMNPLQYAIELLALSQKDLKTFMTLFERLDVERKAKISLDDIFEWLEMPPTAFAKHVFISVDALDADGLLEFGDFLRSIAIFCFFGKADILRFLFTFGDSSGSGSMTHQDFVKLLNTIHPYDKRRTKRALMELDLKTGKTMSFEEFQRIATELPNVFFPAYEVQHVLREKTMGENWWFNKLSKYKGVRKKLKASSVNADEAAHIEMERLEHDEKRQKRMADREALIKGTSSTVVKAILQARQFADEFS